MQPKPNSNKWCAPLPCIHSFICVPTLPRKIHLQCICSRQTDGVFLILLFNENDPRTIVIVSTGIRARAHHTLLPSAFSAVWFEEIHLFNFSYKQPAQSDAPHPPGSLVNPILQNFLLFSIWRGWRLLGSRTIYLLFIYQINTYVKWVLFVVTIQRASTTAVAAATIIIIIITSNSLHSHKFVHSICERSDAKAFGKWREIHIEMILFQH